MLSSKQQKKNPHPSFIKKFVDKQTKTFEKKKKKLKIIKNHLKTKKIKTKPEVNIQHKVTQTSTKKKL